jgi:hypothetical protein
MKEAGNRTKFRRSAGIRKASARRRQLFLASVELQERRVKEGMEEIGEERETESGELPLCSSPYLATIA